MKPMDLQYNQAVKMTMTVNGELKEVKALKFKGTIQKGTWLHFVTPGGKNHLVKLEQYPFHKMLIAPGVTAHINYGL